MIQDAGACEDRFVASPPDHVAIRLVREDRQIVPACDVRDGVEVFGERHSAGRVVRGVQEHGAWLGVVRDEVRDRLGPGSEVFLES